MKILLDHPWPFALAHGGFQIQIEQTKAALEQLGVEVEHTRWWDAEQTGDIIHYFGRPTAGYIDFAHAKSRKVIVAELHSGMGSRSGGARTIQKATMALSRALLPKTFLSRLAWESYQIADGFVALTEWEAQIIREMFGADPARVHVVPNGIEGIFFRRHLGGDYLICTAAIHPRKRIVELAEAAARAQIPVWIIGKPYAEADAYYQRFLKLQEENPTWIHYEGPVEDRERLAEIYSGARGFVLLSTQESLSLSALEATAGGCPLLLSDLPWARTVFGEAARYVSPTKRGAELAEVLHKFHTDAPTIPATFQPLGWEQVAAELVRIYQGLLAA